MKGLSLVAGAALVMATALAFTAPSARAANLCVGNGPGCFSTLQGAVDAAHDGDTIRIGRGTFAGGVTVDVSVELVGAGPARTIIRGGGPVLTIGAFGAASEPTVSIDGVAITGGITRSSVESSPFTGQEGVFAAGGGIDIPPNADFSGGATVTITNSVIAGNRVAPNATVGSGLDCPQGECPFALAGGGGISNWGTLTLRKTVVKNNRIGTASGLSTLASDAEGGAILNWLAPLTIRNSVIEGNGAAASAPNGRFAEGGGLMLFGGTLTMTNSLVAGNHATLAAGLPTSVEQLANGGGMHITSGVTAAAIRNTIIAGNAVSMTNTVGDAVAFSGGIHVDLDVDFTMTGSLVARNSVKVSTSGYPGDAHGDSGGGQFLGQISHSHISGNTVYADASSGNAFALAGAGWVLADLPVTIADSVMAQNHIRAASSTGSASVMGGGLVLDNAPDVPGDAGVVLRNSTVSRNSANARGTSGVAQGGGIFDAAVPPNGPFGSPLTLTNSSIIGNVLTASPSIPLQGGGLYLRDQPLTLNNSVIARNVPDQCFGC
jgi:hypothetical protein